MSTVTVFTSMTNPDERKDPWKQALNCYEDLADEINIIGQKFPEEFKWDYFGKIFQDAFNSSKGDWVFRMDVDYFFHEKDIPKIRRILNKYSTSPAIAFPQYQIFTPDRYQLKTKICLALNKKEFPEIKLNGGGDLVLPTLNGKLIEVSDVPNVKIPIYQYDSTFRTKEIIAKDRARFARAWERQFGNFGNRGGGTPELAFNAWFSMIKERYPKHTFKMNMSDHPKYMAPELEKLKEGQFGFDAFGLKQNTKRPFINYLRGYKEKYLN